MLSRRGFLRLVAGLGLAGVSGMSYAGWVEPAMRLAEIRWTVLPRTWPAGLRLRLALLADIHVGPPWMTPGRLSRIVARTNALAPDMILLLGDYGAAHPLARPLAAQAIAAPLADLSAPLGVRAILGNHDWWEDRAVQMAGSGLPRMAAALREAGIKVMHNRAERIGAPGGAFWLAGLGDQLAFAPSARRHGRRIGADDLPGTLAQVADDAPVILMAHEPDIFPRVPPRVALTLSGHTHGGQVRLMGWSPVVPSRFGNRYAWGHVVEEGRDLVVSGGLGCSIMPVRMGVPPEITLVEIG